MPTLVKFLIVLAFLAGIGGVGMFYLANFVEPRTRELIVRVPQEKLQPTAVVTPQQQAAQPAGVSPTDTTATPAPPAAE
jgi:hypothetical protein